MNASTLIKKFTPEMVKYLQTHYGDLKFPNSETIKSMTEAEVLALNDSISALKERLGEDLVRREADINSLQNQLTELEGEIKKTFGIDSLDELEGLEKKKLKELDAISEELNKIVEQNTEEVTA